MIFHSYVSWPEGDAHKKWLFRSSPPGLSHSEPGLTLLPSRLLGQHLRQGPQGRWGSTTATSGAGTACRNWCFPNFWPPVRFVFTLWAVNIFEHHWRVLPNSCSRLYVPGPPPAASFSEAEELALSWLEIPTKDMDLTNVGTIMEITCTNQDEKLETSH